MLATIEEYNFDVRAGRDVHYLKDPQHMVSIEHGPFYAIARRNSELSLTAVGLRINAAARVHSVKSSYVPGLFAEGDAAGA